MAGNQPPAVDDHDLQPPPPPPAPPADEIDLEPEPPSNGNGNVSPPPPASTGLSDEDRQRLREEARREAEQAMADRLQTMDAELAELRRDREERQRQEDESRRQQEDEARRAEEDDLSARELLERREREWTDERTQIHRRFEEMELQRERERAILDQERRLNEVNAYRERRIGEEADDIMPQLRDMVSGTTEEEIEASINVLKQRSASILESVAHAQGGTTPRPTGSKVTSPPVGPMDSQAGQETLTAQEIAGMSLAEYSQVRDRLLGAVSKRVSESGPYGR